MDEAAGVLPAGGLPPKAEASAAVLLAFDTLFGFACMLKQG